MRILRIIAFSVPLQLLLFFTVPSLVQTLPFMGTSWVSGWESVQDHEIFKSHAEKKVLVLGASYWGERYCIDRINEPSTYEDEVCMLGSILNAEKIRTGKMTDYEFFQVTQGGTMAQVHLYYLLNILESSGDSIKYILYDNPRKFYFNLKSPDYFRLHKKLIAKIESLPPSLKSAKLDHYLEELKADVQAESSLPQNEVNASAFAGVKKTFLDKMGWMGWFESNFANLISQSTRAHRFSELFEKYKSTSGLIQKNEFATPLTIFHDADAIETPEDFQFLEILYELCQRRGIKLIVMFPKDLRLMSSLTSSEPWNSRIFLSTKNHFAGRPGIYLVDYRDLPTYVPRDSIDGVHPSLSAKITLADKLLSYLEGLKQ